MFTNILQQITTPLNLFLLGILAMVLVFGTLGLIGKKR